MSANNDFAMFVENHDERLMLDAMSLFLGFQKLGMFHYGTIQKLECLMNICLLVLSHETKLIG